MRAPAPTSLRGALLALGLLGCGAQAEGTTDTTSSAIIDGVASTAAQNFVVEIVHPVAGGEFVCSGSLVAPNLILTARHCVTETPDLAFSCDESGDGTDGGALGADYDPSTVLVYVGLDAPSQFSSPAGRAVRFFHDDATNVCDHDLALVEVSPPLGGMPIATLDLDETLAVGQPLTVVGWGVTADGGAPAERQQRAGVSILAVGPGARPVGYDLGPSEFDVGESICEGDSGGPALDVAGSVVGVVSRGGNDEDAGPNAASTCVGPSTVNIYTETSAFRDVILSAFAAVGETPALVGAGLGQTCFSSGECTSGVCSGGLSDAGMVCSQSCASAACPSGFRCDTRGGQPLCAAAPASSGCGVSGGELPDGTGLGLVLLSLVASLLRRKRVAR